MAPSIQATEPWTCHAKHILYHSIKIVAKQKGVLTQSWPLDPKNVSSQINWKFSGKYLQFYTMYHLMQQLPVLLFFFFFEVKQKLNFAVWAVKNSWL